MFLERRKGAGKSPFLFLLSMIMLLIPALSAGAAGSATVQVNASNYAHSNQIGKTNFKDTSGRSYLMGDFVQNDAVINWIEFNVTNLAGGTIFIRYPDGSTQTVSNGYVALDQKVKKLEVVLSKTTYKESLAYITKYGTADDSDGGTAVTYVYQKPSVTYGSLGTGNQPEPEPDPEPTPTPPPSTGGGTDTGTDTGGSTGGSTGGGGIIGTDELNATINGSCTVVSWTNKPSGTTQWKVNNDGKISMLPGSQMSYTIPSSASNGSTFDIRALDAAQNQLGKSVVAMQGCAAPEEPGGDTGSGTTEPDAPAEEPCPEACQALKDALECPAFPEYLGKWSDAVADTYPKMADDITDKLAPAIGQQIRDTAPDVAKAIGDDLQSREKPVKPPPALPTFQPEQRRVPEVPKVKEDLNSAVPDFTPDYSEDKGFEIPDPAEIPEIGKDPGYEHKDISNVGPDFIPQQQKDNPDPGYKAPAETPAPSYEQGGNAPAPDYNAGTQSPAPAYQSGGGGDSTKYYQGG